MIIDQLFDISFSILSWIINLFPNSTGFSTEVHTAFSTIGGYVGMFTGILPYGTLLTAITLILTVEISIFIFKSTKWIVSHLPFIGGRS